LIAAATADRARFTAIDAKAVQAAPTKAESEPADQLRRIRAHLVAADRLNDPSFEASARTMAAQMLSTDPTAFEADPFAADAMQFRTFTDLYALTGDKQWAGLAEQSRDILREQLEDLDQKLPVDAATVDNGAVTIAAQSNYGEKAQTIALSLKDSCDPADAHMAQELWLSLRDSSTTRVASELQRNGKTVDNTPSALAAVATAAVAEVAGEHVQSLQLLERADVIAKDRPDPESSAWNALGRIIVSTDWLGAC
jgi:hypothetical protein